MRTLISALVLFACAAGLGARDGEKFASKDGRFAATFPGEPKVSTNKAGATELTITIVEKDKTGFAVIYSDIPADALKAAGADKVLEGGEKGLLANLKVTAKTSEKGTFKAGDKEHPTRAFVAEKGDKHFRVKLVLADTRLYQILVIGEKDVVNGKAADEFVKSFELTK